MASRRRMAGASSRLSETSMWWGRPMSNNLSGRIGKLEGRFLTPAHLLRVIRVLARQGQEDEALQLAASEGFDPDNGDIVIMRSIVTPRGRPGCHIPSRILSRSADHVR